MFPLISPAYARAREYTCDLHGLACCEDARDAGEIEAVVSADARVDDLETSLRQERAKAVLEKPRKGQLRSVEQPVR